MVLLGLIEFDPPFQNFSKQFLSFDARWVLIFGFWDLGFGFWFSVSVASSKRVMQRRTAWGILGVVSHLGVASHLPCGRPHLKRL
jgi:hypothetical protein